MATTKLKRKLISPNELTDKECRFAAEYVVDFCATRAAKAAGFKTKAMGAVLLSRPHVVAAIGALRQRQLDKIELRKEEILEQLCFLATRELSDYVDDDGRLLPPGKMSRRARCTIDSIDQSVTTDPDTGEETVRTRYRITPKATGIDLAMKYAGMFAPDRHVVATASFNVDWEKLYEEKELTAQPFPQETKADGDALPGVRADGAD